MCCLLQQSSIAPEVIPADSIKLKGMPLSAGLFLCPPTLAIVHRLHAMGATSIALWSQVGVLQTMGKELLHLTLGG